MEAAKRDQVHRLPEGPARQLPDSAPRGRFEGHHHFSPPLSAGELNELVRVERARCDRCHTSFSLVVVKVMGGGRRRDRFSELLRQRVRISDAVGVFDLDEVAVLLTDTGSDGAQAVAADLESVLAESGDEADVEIYTYPHEPCGGGRPGADEPSPYDAHESTARELQALKSFEPRFGVLRLFVLSPISAALPLSWLQWAADEETREVVELVRADLADEAFGPEPRGLLSTAIGLVQFWRKSVYECWVLLGHAGWLRWSSIRIRSARSGGLLIPRSFSMQRALQRTEFSGNALTRLLDRLIGRWIERRVSGTATASEFELAFQRERARAERSGSSFSMVVIECTGNRAMPYACELVRERKREYDVLGRIDSHRIGVLLPETTSDKTWMLVDDLLARASDAGLRWNVEVFAYPRSWSTEPSPPARPTVCESPRLRDPGLAGVRAPLNQRPVRDLYPVFVQPPSLLRRATDIVVASTVLVLVAPVMLLTAIAIKLNSPGPVIFRKHCAGLGGTPFYFYKFRSMHVDADRRRAELEASNEQDGPVFKIRDDPRMTSIGRIMRRTSIDELPQLWNVLRGDMTLIGPRPHSLEEVEGYKPWQWRRLETKGGLTCIWQVSGRHEIGFEDWVRMDIQYQQRSSLLFDAKLLANTVGAVLSRRGAD